MNVLARHRSLYPRTATQMRWYKNAVSRGSDVQFFCQWLDKMVGVVRQGTNKFRLLKLADFLSAVSAAVLPACTALYDI